MRTLVRIFEGLKERLLSIDYLIQAIIRKLCGGSKKSKPNDEPNCSLRRELLVEK